MLIVAVLASTCAATSRAGAGGSHLAFDRPWYDVEDVAVATSDLYPGCCDRGWVDDGPYFAWARPGGALDDAPTFLGPVRIDLTPVEGQSLPRPVAVLEFVVPALQPGHYQVTICNEGCVKELGDLIGGLFWIGLPVETPPPVDLPPPAVAVDQGVLLPRSSEYPPDSSLVPWVAGGAVIALGAGVIGLMIASGRRRRAQG